MSAADEALEAAEKLIEEAIQKNLNSIRLDGYEFRKMTKLPDKLSQLTDLRELFLSYCDVADISVLSSARKLSKLHLGTSFQISTRNKRN